MYSEHQTSAKSSWEEVHAIPPARVVRHSECASFIYRHHHTILKGLDRYKIYKFTLDDDFIDSDSESLRCVHCCPDAEPHQRQPPACFERLACAYTPRPTCPATMPDSSKPAVPELAIVVAPMVGLLPSIAHLLMHASRDSLLRLSSWPRECLMCSNSKMLLLSATSG